MKPSHKILGHLITSIGIIATLVAIGCGTQPNHPNQLNTFDGATYDALTLTQGALTSMRTPIASALPKYAPAFNDAAGAYWAAVTAYKAWRCSVNDKANLATSLGDAAAAIVSLEATIESDLDSSDASRAEIHARADQFRSRAKASLSAPDVLAALEFASALAQSKATTKNTHLVQLILNGTEAAVQAGMETASKPIDVTTLAPVAPIS